MRPSLALLFWLLVSVAGSANALGRLVQPDGSVLTLAEQANAGGVTLLFPSRDLDLPSWLTLPEGFVPTRAEIAAPGIRRLVRFPRVTVPGLRYALQVPAHLFSLSLRGKLGPSRTLVRTLESPDVAGQAWVALAPDRLTVDLPLWKTPPDFTPVLTLTRAEEGAWRTRLSEGTRSRTFTLRPSVLQWSFSPAAWGFTPTRVEVVGSGALLTDVRVQALSANENLPVDPETLIAWPATAWRNPQREWFAWAGTAVLVLVTADYRVQDAYLKRLAFFVEKTGFRGRLVSDEEMAPLHGWNAHDYAAPDLARFFTLAAQQNFPLHAAEVELRERLTAAGVLVSHQGAWEPGHGALVGISQASASPLRSVLFTHESFHGLYFTTEAFRAGVRTTWNSLSEGARSEFRAYLAQSQYDPTDEPLMINEFQAYTLQRPAADWPEFFRERVLAHAERGPQLATWMEQYLAAAKSLDTLVGSLFGVRSGNVSLVATP